MNPEQRRIRRELERDYRKKQRARITELRHRVRHAKRWRRARAKKVRALCQHARLLAKGASQVIRAQHKAAAQREIEALRKRDRDACEARKRKAISDAQSGVARAAAHLASELEQERIERIYSQKPKLRRAAAARQRVERAHESDAEVENNIPHELVPVFRVVKSTIKATPFRTRTEAFAEWANEHQARVREILDRQIEQSIEDLIAAELEQRRELEGGRRALAKLSDPELQRRHRAVAEPLQAVPF
jgi:hypothetical protein